MGKKQTTSEASQRPFLLRPDQILRPASVFPNITHRRVDYRTHVHPNCCNYIGRHFLERIRFHFEGGLSDHHHMNFYEAARFQYAAARLTAKLMQFRVHGRFTKRIT